MSKIINRRKFLLSSGGFLALPQLASTAEKENKAPERLAFLSFGFGFTKEFFPREFGGDYAISPGMKPLEKHRSDISLVSNLYNQFAKDPHGGSTTYLTGANWHVNRQNAISCDQVAARHMGTDTRFRSIQLAGKDRDGHGLGSSLSWNETGNSMSSITDPFRLFDLLFGGSGMSYEERLSVLDRRKSFLDTHVQGIKNLQRDSSALDRERLDQYFQTLREIEQRIEKDKIWAKKPKPKIDYTIPHAVSTDGIAETKVMYDLMILAMQTDSSRVFTYRQPQQNVLKKLGISFTGHQVSHYTNVEARKKAGQRRERCYSEMFAYFIDQLKETKDVDGSRIFDNCLVSYGSNIRTSHMLRNVPAFVTGNVRNKIKHGRHIAMPEDSALSNLWLTLLQTLALPIEEFSDSDGSVSELLG